MGCDIHVRLEIKNRENEWAPCEVYVKDKYRGTEDPEFCVLDVYHDRDYELFSALCGVRDRSGLIPKISKPKGIPSDASKEAREYLIDSWDCDGHSHSWNTLAELYDYQDKYSIVERSGLISQESAKLLDEGGVKPSSWCQGSSNQNLVRRQWLDGRDVMASIINAVELQVKRVNYIWNAKDNSENIRILYCFDN